MEHTRQVSRHPILESIGVRRAAMRLRLLVVILFPRKITASIKLEPALLSGSCWCTPSSWINRHVLQRERAHFHALVVPPQNRRQLGDCLRH